jgi:hypothetical protein
MECVLEFKPFDGVSVTTVDAMLLANSDMSPHAPSSVSSSSHNVEVYTLAVGAESGDIKLWKLTVIHTAESNAANSTIQSVSCDELFAFPSTICHGSTVKKLRWRHQYPYNYTDTSRNNEASSGGSGDKTPVREHWLASCGEDFGVRVFSVKI